MAVLNNFVRNITNDTKNMKKKIKNILQYVEHVFVSNLRITLMY